MRPALTEDLAPLQELARRTIDASYRSFLGDESVDWFLDSGASDDHIAAHVRQAHAHCMEVDGRLVGLTILDGPTIDLMMIDAAHRRRGLGRALLSHTEKTLFARYEALCLESFADNAAANAFYTACGWSVAARLESETPAKVELVKRRVTVSTPHPARPR
ncbi:GNAT family N-acetyltransferase [Streptomyces edwardsiae]|uniref:GNAT family N-acetyltransferase n=1 Tax=Streptomyces edwardsiae TaxID=3075527 RepID=A0ABU2Q1L2_9ACTN|nr:GNAT family N-acetyltransferase [Streptomyces sp. DSM 41636]MDT0397400.1 GNAT family N-acetyltransferase [Streptomyces sp. DSM 41636]